MDKFLKDIKTAISAEIDPKKFEAFAVDMIRQDHPGTNAVVGGGDGGRDGAVPDLQGEPIPILTTTQADVAANVRKSIASYLKRGGPRRECIVATNRTINPTQQTKLYADARELGFTILNIYDHHSVAERLYNSPRWCRDLLDLTLELATLSKVSPHARANLSPIRLIGRDENLKWLREIRNDSVVTGQPGSGKTALFEQFAEDKDVYFATTADETKLTSAIREFKPRVIIVDDAHVELPTFETLRRIKKEANGEYLIVAVVWPSKVAEWKQRLMVTDKNVHEVGLLPRALIVDIIKELGVHGPTPLVREIVNQAEGRAGLAVLLTTLAKSGDFEAFLNGDLLIQFVISSLERSSANSDKFILATYALGGSQGMSNKTVSHILEIPLTEIARFTAELNAAGIITDTGEKLAIRPAALRYALVRDVYMRGSTGLNLNEVIQLVGKDRHIVGSVLGAVHRGGATSASLLESLIDACDDADLTEAYAALGASQTHYLLNKHIDRILSFAQHAILHFPKEAYACLFTLAVDDDRIPTSTTSHPLRVIQDYIDRMFPGERDALGARSDLLAAIIDWLGDENSKDVAFKILPTVFSPNIGNTEMDAIGDAFQITNGSIGEEEFEGLKVLWERLAEFARADEDFEWSRLTDIVSTLAYPHRENSEEARKTRLELIQTIINEISEHSKALVATIHKLRGYADRLGLEKPHAEESFFYLLYPEKDLYVEDRKGVAEELMGKALDTLQAMSIDEATSLICECEKAAKEARLEYPRLTYSLMWKIAEQTPSLMEWITLLRQKNAPLSCISPFLATLANSNKDAWILFAKENIATELEYEILELCLRTNHYDEELWETIAPNLGKVVRNIEYGGKALADRTLQRLLEHQDPKVRFAALLAEFHTLDGRKTEINAAIRPLWNAALANSDDDDHWLTEMLAIDKSVALQWVRNRFTNGVGYNHEKKLKTVFSMISGESRRSLLETLPIDQHNSRSILFSLVGDDIDLVRDALTHSRLRNEHLALAGYPKMENWSQRIELLGRSGRSVHEVASFVLPRSYFGSGKSSDRWRGWQADLEHHQHNENAFVAAVARATLDIIDKQLSKTLAEEAEVAVRGRY
ncbi:MAG: hypothetical protein EOP06_03280 [Proteobacteria bacterium]|nr:MAG: hypothetical protein EOP06_03280 [Pseudomonadota bacterium]